MKHTSLCRAALAGFAVGVFSAAAYLLLGGEYLLEVPRWARIVFYPGFVAGDQAYQWVQQETIAKVVGVLTVGLTYALIGAVLGCVRPGYRRRQRERSMVSPRG